MLRLAKLFLWTLIFCALLLAMDQFFLRVSPTVSAHTALRQFYLDLRGRLGHLLEGESRDTVESVIRQSNEGPVLRKTGPPSSLAEPSPRYLYADGDGQLQFADSLEDVPVRYRREARPLDR